MKKYALILNLIIAIIFQVNSQEVIIPPSPNAASLGTYGDCPVNLFTGSPSISIPLYKIEEPGINLDIALNYNAKGIKVEEVASWVGLGWSLNAGGLITRSVHGFPDDMKGDNKYYRLGYLYIDNAKAAGTTPTNREILHNFDVDQSDHDAINTITRFGGLGLFGSDTYEVDLNPDIFYFNFGNETGKFVFDKNGTIQVLGSANLNLDYSVDADGKIESFTVCDNNGTKYYFQDIETSTIEQVFSELVESLPESMHVNYKSIYLNQYSYNSSWLLSKIETANGNQIDFLYEDESYTYSNRLSGINVIEKIEVDVAGKRLSNISSTYADIDFVASLTDRLDLPGSSYLEKIIIKAKPYGKTFKDYTFMHKYLDASTKSNIACENFRLALTDIFEGSNGSYKSPYVFKYNETVNLPHRSSFEQDIWGYYNGNGANALFPNLYVYPREDNFNKYRIYPIPNYSFPYYYLNDGADRRHDADKMQANILNKIIYPTGGYSQYFYQPHSYYYNEENTTAGDGLRVAKIIYNDGIADAKVEEFTYKNSTTNNNSGVLIQKPNLAYFSNQGRGVLRGKEEEGYSDIYRIESFPDDGEYTWESYVAKKAAKGIYLHTLEDLMGSNWTIDSEEYYKYLLNRMENGTKPLGSYGGYSIGYSEVTKKIVGQGCTKYYFDTKVAYGDISDDVDQLYFPPNTHKASKNGASCFYWYHNITTSINSYPFTAMPNYDWNRGQLLNVKIFNEGGDLLKESINEYSVFYKDNRTEPNYIYGIAYNTISPPMKSSCYWNIDCQEPIYLFKKYHYLCGVEKVLSLTTEKTYDPTDDPIDDPKYVESQKAFDYNKYGQIETLIASNYESNIKTEYKTEYKYPHSFTNDLVSTSMADPINNIINPPIEIINYKANKYIGATINKYECYNCETNSDGILVSGKFLPAITYSLETNSPLTDYTPVTSDFTIDNRCKEQFYYDKYDDAGNILQVHTRNGIKTSYMWDFNKLYPTAEVKNANADEIFFESFEDNNWIEDYHNGANSLLVMPGEYGLSEVLENLSHDKEYALSVWVKTEDGFDASNSNHANLIIKVKDESNDAQLALLTTSITQTEGKWKLFERSVNLADYLQDAYIEIEVLNSNNSNYILIDDVRFHPKNAIMTSFTYEPLKGMTSKTDGRNISTSYELDDLSRLLRVRDNNSNILKEYKYNYSQSRFIILPLESKLIPAEGGSVGYDFINVNSDPYSYTVSEDWLELQSETSSALIFSVLAYNDCAKTRVCSVIITDDNTGKSKTFYVTQKGQHVDLSHHHQGTGLPSAASPGDIIPLKCRLTHNGNTPTVNGCVSFILSKTRSGSDPVVTTTECLTIAKGSTVEVTTNMTIPSGYGGILYLVMESCSGSKLLNDNTQEGDSEIIIDYKPPYEFDEIFVTKTEPGSTSNYNLSLDPIPSGPFDYSWQFWGINPPDDNNVGPHVNKCSGSGSFTVTIEYMGSEYGYSSIFIRRIVTESGNLTVE